MKTIFSNDAATAMRRKMLRETRDRGTERARQMRRDGKSILCKEFAYTPSAGGSRILNEFTERRIRERAAA